MQKEIKINWPQKSKREIWLSISSCILDAQQEYPYLKYVEQLNATYAVYLDYIYPENIDLYLLPSHRLQLCQLIYVGQATVEIKQRATLLLEVFELDKEAFSLGFCRFYDVAVHLHGMLIESSYEFITGTVDISLINENHAILVQTLKKILQINDDNMVQAFSNLMTTYFLKFKLFVLKHQLQQQKNIIKSSSTTPRKLSFTTKTINNLPYKNDPVKVDLCKKLMESQALFEVNSDYEILKSDAIQFCLIYLIRNLLDDENNIHLRQNLVDILNILENPSPNNKKYRALNPKSSRQYKEKSKIYYKQIYQVIEEAAKGPGIPRHQSFKQAFTGYYLAHSDHKGFSIKYGEISIVSKNGQFFLQVHNLPYPKQPPSGNINIVIPGFINLHTHTRYSFQGNVNFGSLFEGRFDWRQNQFQGKHVIQLNKYISKQYQPQQQYRKYVKFYTQLQALIGGTTTIFEQSRYDLQLAFPNIIRNTLLPQVRQKQSFYITSNDIYVIWRNEKKKNDLMLAWSKDYIQFFRSVIEIELAVLQSYESHLTNLNIHLAQGKSKNGDTIVQFDNFCEDIICMQHFLKHLKNIMRDKSLKFEKKFIIQCQTKTQNVSGSNIVSARSVDGNFSSFMTIKKIIQYTGNQGQIKTKIDLKIHYHHRFEDGSKQVVQVCRIPHEQLVQVYQIHTLRSNLLIIHGNGMNPSNQLHQYIVKTYNVFFCISPYSNISLYGGVNDFNWKDLMMNDKYSNSMCISTDWSPTGKQNLIQQIRFMLKKLKQVNYNIDSDLYHKIFRMITVNPARIAKIPAGQIKDSFFADFWIGNFSDETIIQNDKISVDKLIEHILTQYSYQNRISRIFSKGRLVFSSKQQPGLQLLDLKYQKKKYFYNPEGSQNMDFQKYVKKCRDLLIETCKSPISLLFP